MVRFVGRVHFAPGIWVGLEIRGEPRPSPPPPRPRPRPRHDGCVDGRRYFSCRPGRGVVVRPGMVSVHGISGERLLRPEAEYPF